MPAVRAVAFDFNGTLSRDEQILCAIYQELFAEHGKPISEAGYYDTLAGRSEEAIISGWLGVDGDELATLIDERLARYRDRAADGSTIPLEHRDAVRYASERVPVAIVSGAFREEIEPVLRACALDACITHVVTADDVARGKPDPEGYARLVALLRLHPASVVAFEDTEAGIASAKDAGLRCVAVSGTLDPSRLARADELVERIDVELMRRLLG